MIYGKKYKINSKQEVTYLGATEKNRGAYL